MDIALLCGGPSRERGISLNSARSFLDHTKTLEMNLLLFYLHPSGLFYELSSMELYSNTPADFDFKLSSQKKGMSEEEFIQRLRGVDLVFPLIHGPYGEDGKLQKALEKASVPFAGSKSEACERMFNKYLAHSWLKKHGIAALPALAIRSPGTDISTFWKAQGIQKGIIKPTLSGSSIGIRVVHSIVEAREAIADLWEEGFEELLLEPYSEDLEFTICVLENKGKAVSLIPLEIAIKKGEIFDYRKKYLPSLETRYYCPPRFSKEKIALIRKEAERLFQLFEIRGFARIDGWVAKDGSVRFSDFNPISGMEQNSFFFQQAARVGLSHTDLLEYLLNQALFSYKKPPVQKKKSLEKQKKPVYVLMGGGTSEKQVSLLSGTNVWLKLFHHSYYSSFAFLLDTKGKVWQLPYDFALHHTVEEMEEHCQKAHLLIQNVWPLIKEIRARLELSPLEKKLAPASMSLRSFFNLAAEQKAFVFLGLHGGKGENGSLQKLLENKGLSFNGSRAKSSKLCMDKRKTAIVIQRLCHPHILPMPQMALTIDEKKRQEPHVLWQKAVKRLRTEDLLIKPQKDGCSTGVARLKNSSELARYMNLILERKHSAPVHFFAHHPFPIEMPLNTHQFLIEPFIETDRIYALDTEIRHEKISGWCEMTIGVLERKGKYRALNPSLTLANHHILSVEEKFQGGTGINITPPPLQILSSEACGKVRTFASQAAKALGIEGYARLDLFVECATGNIRVIEANTLPALSPSTVLYHQALAETPPITPQELLAQIIESQ